jgi:hypothetical protein
MPCPACPTIYGLVRVTGTREQVADGPLPLDADGLPYEFRWFGSVGTGHQALRGMIVLMAADTMPSIAGHGRPQRRGLGRTPAPVPTFMYRPMLNGTVALQKAS